MLSFTSNPNLKIDAFVTNKFTTSFSPSIPIGAFVTLTSTVATNLALQQAYVLANDARVIALQLKTQFQSYTLDLSENRNSTLFDSNIKVTNSPIGIDGENEVVNLFVTKPSTFKLGMDVKESIRNEGTLNQIGTSNFLTQSTFNDNVNLVDYVKKFEVPI